MAVFVGTPGDDGLHGGPDADIFDMSQGGDDTVHGKGGDDIFRFGATLTDLDSIIGGSGMDTVQLDGDYSAGLTLAASTFQNVEALLLAGGSSYSLTMADGNVRANHLLSVDASTLTQLDHLSFDGSAELDGHYSVQGGAGDDTVTGGQLGDHLVGGAGNDTIRGGRGADTIHGNAGDDQLGGGQTADTIVGGKGNDTIFGGVGLDDLNGRQGADTFLYGDVSQSTNRVYDTIDDFNTHHDLIDLNVSVAAIDAMLSHGSLSDGPTYVSDFEAAITSDVLQAGHAVVWQPDAGTDAGDIYVVIDANGTAGFQSGQDYIIELEDPQNLADLSTATFV